MTPASGPTGPLTDTIDGATLDDFPPGWQERASLEDLPAAAQRLAELAVDLERSRQLERALRAMTEAVWAQRRVVTESSDEQLLSGGAWRPLATLLGHRRRLLRATGRPGELGDIDDELAGLHERLNHAIQRAAGLLPPAPGATAPEAPAEVPAGEEPAEVPAGQPAEVPAALREQVARRRAEGDLAGGRAAQERLVAALAHADAPELAAAVSELASLHWELGDYRPALATAERAVAIHDQSGEPVPAAARDLTKLGSMRWQLGDLPAARDALARAVAASQREYGLDHLEVARCLAHLGTVHYDLQEFAAARGAQERALAILDRELGPDHRETLFVVHCLGRSLRELGDRAGAHAAQQRAAGGYQRALDQDRQRLGWHHPRVARTARRLQEVRSELARLAAGTPWHEPAGNG